jgi:TorA maturation chaperone TorD
LLPAKLAWWCGSFFFHFSSFSSIAGIMKETDSHSLQAPSPWMARYVTGVFIAKSHPFYFSLANIGGKKELTKKMQVYVPR